LRRIGRADPGIEIDAPSRVARGETIEIKATLHGEIPAQALVEWDGIAAARQTCHVLPDPVHGTGLIVVRRERVERTLRFQVRANDAVSAWHEIMVVPPPTLVPYDGRPSPRVRLRYPPYTDLPDQEEPDGAGNNVDEVRVLHPAMDSATAIATTIERD